MKTMTLALLLIGVASVRADTPASQPAAELGPEIRAAARAVVDGLTPEQRKLADQKYEPRAIRLISLFPGQRAGVRLGDLNDEQRARVTKLLATVLSPRGLDRARTVFKQGSGAGDYYYVQFHNGGPRDPLVWRMEGHHFSLTVFVDEKDRVRPGTALIGGRPADLWNDLRDDARAVYASLDASQKRAATAKVSPRRTANKPFSDPVGTGLDYARLTSDQQKRVTKLLAGFRSLLRPEVLKQAGHAFLKRGGEAKLRIVFAGDAVREDGEFYCGVTGAGLHVEFDNRQGHVHMLVHFSSDTLHNWRLASAGG